MYKTFNENFYPSGEFIIDVIDSVISLAIIISYLEYSTVIFTLARESIKQIFILENVIYKLFIPACIDMF